MPRNRPAGVIVSAIIQILGSLFTLLMSALMLLIPLISKSSPHPKPPFGAGFIYGEAALYGVFAVLGFLTAIGLFRMKNWARLSTLIFSPIPILIGISFAAVFVVMPMLPGPADDLKTPGFKAVVTVTMLIGLGIAALGVFWLYYFNRTTTKLAFAIAAGDTGSLEGIQIDGQSVPTSIAVIAAFALLGALGSLPGLFLNSPALMFGFAMRGVPAKAIYVLLVLLQLYAGIALVQLNSAGRTVAIALHSLWLLNSATFAFIPATRLSKFVAEVPRWGQAQSSSRFELGSHSMLLLMRAGGAFGVLTSATILYFLVTRGWAFRKGEAAQAAAG
jgi:hypothetical protein